MNYTKQYLDGYLSDEPLSRYEKLKSTRHQMTNDKARTIARDKARRERLRVVEVHPPP
jgi:hypothetical protein